MVDLIVQVWEVIARLILGVESGSVMSKIGRVIGICLLLALAGLMFVVLSGFPS